jgi:hypothetical protein
MLLVQSSGHRPRQFLHSAAENFIRTIMPEYKSVETGTRELWYEKDFRKWLREKKNLPRAVLELVDDADTDGKKACAGEVCLTCVDINTAGDVAFSKSFKIEIGGEKFFLKIEQEDIPTDAGFKEMQDTLLAKEVLEPANIKGVRVVNPLMGYSDKKERSYFISEWIDLPLLDEVISELEMKNQKEAKRLLKRVNEIRGVLSGYRELSPCNMFYNKKTDEIILFDLHL